MRILEFIPRNDPRMIAGLKALRAAGYEVRAQENVPGKKNNSTKFSYYIYGNVSADELHNILDPIFPDGFLLQTGIGRQHQVVKFIIPRFG